MKPSSSIIARIFFLAACWVALLGGAQGQSVSVIHNLVSQEGAFPMALIQGKDGNFYGTSVTGGTAGLGSIYKVTPQGAVIVLHSFGDSSVLNDGTVPLAGLTQGTDGNFYGTTMYGGAEGCGTVFIITPQGAVTILHSFNDGSVVNDGDGSIPRAGLIQAMDGNFYGTTSTGAIGGGGTVFEITPQGTLSVLHSFNDGTVLNDGYAPEAGLAQDAQGNFYGTTSNGGSKYQEGQGTVYKIDTQKHFSILYSFNQTTPISINVASPNAPSSGHEGAPNSRLVVGADGNLYGTTAPPGFSGYSIPGFGYGTFFKITPQGQETVLHHFGDGTVANDGQETTLQSNGENILIQGSDGNFYGTTFAGGSAGKGTVFEMTPGGQETILHSFGDGTVATDGIYPVSGVVQGTDGNFYGATDDDASYVIEAISISGLTPNPPVIGCTETFPQPYVPVPGRDPGTLFKIVPALPMITSSLNVTGAVGLAFSYQILATQTPTSYAASGLPPGLSLDSASGLISGTPTALGTSEVTITVTNSAGSGSSTLVISILSPPSITSILTAFGSTSSAFGYQITASEGPISLGATGLPAGLSLNPTTGIIYGTPGATGSFPVTLSATNVAGTGSATLTLTVTATASALSSEYVLLHSFNDGSVSGEGVYSGPLTPGPNSTFYGLTAPGGSSSSEAVYNLSAAGSATPFAGLGSASGSSCQGLIQGTDGDLYGTTPDGGSAHLGTIFKVAPDGTVTVLHTFGDLSVTNDGANPRAGVIQGADGNFYGTTQYGGSANLGTIFEMTPQGVVTILHSFVGNSAGNDGAQPVAGLIEVNGVFYGTTLAGGSGVGTVGQTDSNPAGYGTAFSFSAASPSVVTILYSFGTQTNDGEMPEGGLVYFNAELYGTTFSGGSAGKGTVYALGPMGGGISIMHNFGDGYVTNDGINPVGSLVAIPDRAGQSAELYGVTQNGGSSDQNTGFGTIFKLDTLTYVGGIPPTIIHSFGDGSVANDGQIPLAGLCLGADGNLYGTTVGGGAGYGTAFAVAANLLGLPPGAIPSSYYTITGNLPAGLTFDSATGTIAGAPLSTDPLGDYNVTISYVTDNGSYTQFTQPIPIVLTQPFAEWVATCGMVGASPGANASDGIPNLLKYLCDIDPTTTASATDLSALPTLGIDTTTTPGTEYITLTYRQNVALTGVNVVFQTSTDMQNWTDVSQPDISQQIGTDATTGDPIMEVGVKATGSKQFLRLNVASP